MNCPALGHGVGIEAVIQLTVIEDVRQRIPLARRLQRHFNLVVRNTDRAWILANLVARLQHRVLWVGTYSAVLRSVLVERNGEGIHLSVLNQTGRPQYAFGCDEVQRSLFVIGSPSAPIADALTEISKVTHWLLHSPLLSVCFGRPAFAYVLEVLINLSEISGRMRLYVAVPEVLGCLRQPDR